MILTSPAPFLRTLDVSFERARASSIASHGSPAQLVPARLAGLGRLVWRVMARDGIAGRGVSMLSLHARDLRQLVWCVPWSAPMRVGSLVNTHMIVEGGAAQSTQ